MDQYLDHICKECQTNEIRIIRPHRENVKERNAKTYSPWAYYVRLEQDMRQME